MKQSRRARFGRSAAVAMAVLSALLPLTVLGGGGGAAEAGAQVVPPRIDRPVVPELLETAPVKGWGVVGYQAQTGIVNRSWVWDFAQVGDRLFVGGSFTGVQQNYFGVQTPPPVQNQRFLAAFNVDTNEWISTFVPTFNAPVFSLEATPDGKLLVGGAFTTVNGVARQGLAKIDPVTGAVDAAFTTTVAQDGTTFPTLLREITIDGQWAYLAGDFNRVVRGAERNGVYSVARVRWSDGAFDYTWRPRVTGAGVNDVEPDPSRNRVHLAGNFTAVNASPSTAYQAVVNDSDGATVTNVAAFQQDSAQFWEFGVALNAGRAWTAGSQHQVQVLDAGTRSRLDWYRTGTAGTSFNADGLSFFSGGDYQVIEAIDDFVIAGCHCLRQDYGGLDLARMHYWSGANQFSAHSFAIAYDAVTRRPLSFIPGLVGNYYGTWALGSDTNGCLYIGGDYQRASNGLVLGGFGRFCRPASAPQGLTATATGSSSLRLEWLPAEFNGSGLSRYRVARNGVFLGETTGLSFNVGGLAQNTNYTFTVSAVATDNRVSPAASVTTSIAADTVAPSTPANVVLSTNGVDNVTVGWTPSTDNVAVTGYLVHRNFQFLAYIPGGAANSYIDTTVAANQTYTYQVRAQDGAGNLSAPSPTQNIRVGSADLTPPSVPGNVTLATNGTSNATISWTASTDNVAVTGYLVHRNFQFLAFVPVGTTYTDTAVTAGQTYTYQVRAQDGAGNNSNPSPAARITIAPGGVDTETPTVPGNPQGTYTAGVGVVLTWTASTDNDALNGYLVHRNFQFLAFVPAGTTYTDPTVTPGQTYTYQIRAQDRSLNNSAPTNPLTITIP